MQTEPQTPISRLLAWTEHSPNAICSSPKFDQRGFSLKRSCEEQGMPNDGKAQSVRLALSASPDGSIIWRPSVNANGQESICLLCVRWRRRKTREVVEKGEEASGGGLCNKHSNRKECSA